MKAEGFHQQEAGRSAAEIPPHCKRAAGKQEAGNRNQEIGNRK